MKERSQNIVNFLLSTQKHRLKLSKIVGDFLIVLLFLVFSGLIFIISSKYVFLVCDASIVFLSVIAMFVFKRNYERACVVDILLFSVLPFNFMSIISIEMQITSIFWIFFGSGCIFVLVAQIFLLKRKIKENYFQENTKKVSPKLFLITTVCSALGGLLGRLTSLFVSDDVMTDFLFLFCILMSFLFAFLLGYNFTALYFFHKYRSSFEDKICE